jgi:AcrR family transcriptional regulator
VPTPARTSRTEIVAAGRALVEVAGLEALTMQRVAAAVGVQAPSLYKHVASRGALVRLIVEAVVDDLASALDARERAATPREDLRSLADAFRRFAGDHPETYRLIFAPLPDEWRPDPGRLADASRPVLEVAAKLVGPDRALEAARTLTAWAHGFVSMELADAFRLGGDVGSAFEFGVARLADALVG